MQSKLAIESKRLDEINAFLTDPENKLVNDLLAVVEKYGSPEEINRKAKEAGKVENLMARLKEKNSPYLKDLEWLMNKGTKEALLLLMNTVRKS